MKSLSHEELVCMETETLLRTAEAYLSMAQGLINIEDDLRPSYYVDAAVIVLRELEKRWYNG